MADVRWTNIRTDTWADNGSLEPVSEFIAGLDGISENEVGDRLDEIELLRRRCVSRAKRGRKTGVKAKIALVNFLADFARQGRQIRLENGELQIENRVAADKEQRRNQLEALRREQLRTPSVQAFVRRMERIRWIDGKPVSIISLIRDGRDLAATLEKAVSGPEELEKTIKPYLEIVISGQKCQHTGLLLTDIWRYFRYTWTNPYQPIPGRSMLMLIRDAAVAYHPVMGIAALSSAAVKVRHRDIHIGWEPAWVTRELEAKPTKRALAWLEKILSDRLNEIYKNDFLEDGTLTPADLQGPAPELITELREQTEKYRRQHQSNMSASEYKKWPDNPGEDNAYWENQARNPLFRSKRATELGTLLKIRSIMRRGEIKEQSKEKLKEILSRADGRQAVGQLVRIARSKTVGTAIADLTVCGAVPPYGPILGGKLAAMLSVCPEVVKEYRRRYGRTPSVIASSMAGRAIFRPADLVFITATSLYGDRPTQYDRISIPGELLGGKKGIPLKYRFFGKRTFGFGTFQYSDITIRSVMDFLNAENNDARVNFIFGEGANPKMRALREGLNKLGFDEEKELQHGHQKPIYGVSLVSNAKEYLLQMVKKPRYLYSFIAPKNKTEAIVGWWRDRWLKSRITKPDVLKAVRLHNLVYPIKHGARVQLPRTDIDQLKLF